MAFGIFGGILFWEAWKVGFSVSELLLDSENRI